MASILLIFYHLSSMSYCIIFTIVLVWVQLCMNNLYTDYWETCWGSYLNNYSDLNENRQLLVFLQVYK